MRCCWNSETNWTLILKLINPFFKEKIKKPLSLHNKLMGISTDPHTRTKQKYKAILGLEPIIENIPHIVANCLTHNIIIILLSDTSYIVLFLLGKFYEI